MAERLRPLSALIARLMFARYLLASFCALAGDMALFLALDALGVAPMPAAAGGYVGGLLLHWMLSIRFVFDTGTGPTHAQRAGFIASALVGMGITVLTVGGLTALGIAPAFARLAAVPVGFLCVYAIRKYGVFARA